MEMHEIEELIKSVNRNAIKAMLRNAAILSDPNISDELKAQALDNVRAITSGNTKKPKKPKKVKSAPPGAPTEGIQESPIARTPQPPKLEYPEGLHATPLNTAGHNETAMRSIFESLPDHEKQHVVDWHSKLKVNKSIDSLYSLFQELKKHL